VFTIRALDVLALVTLLLVRRRRREGRGRHLLRTAAMGGASMWLYLVSLPPTTCSCIGPRIRPCDNTLRYVATMKSDLKYLSGQQEIYRSDHGTYASDPEALGFFASDGVRVRIEADERGWSAVATHVARGEDRPCRVALRADEEVGLGITCDR
jgi:hypothetical protein